MCLAAQTLGSAGHMIRPSPSTVAMPMASLPIPTGEPAMQQLKKDLALADLPAPVSLTPDQLMAIAAGTAATLRAPGFFPIIVAGGIIGGGPVSAPIPMPQFSV
jgi:hypothetical protein